MNKHFEDTGYYLKRAVQEAKRGVSEELEPLQKRVDELLGGEEEPEQSRVDEIRADLKVVQEKAEGEAKEAIADARERLATRTKAAE
jgi:Skp family chaperone for outer membrane proteins